jgi:hypothetical protein
MQLIFSSARTRLDRLIEEFFLAFDDRDTPRLKTAAIYILLVAGEVALLRFTSRLLERWRVAL